MLSNGTNQLATEMIMIKDVLQDNRVVDPKQLREKYRLSAKDIATLMGINNVANYYRLESGARSLTLQHKATLRLLAAYLECQGAG